MRGIRLRPGGSRRPARTNSSNASTYGTWPQRGSGWKSAPIRPAVTRAASSGIGSLLAVEDEGGDAAERGEPLAEIEVAQAGPHLLLGAARDAERREVAGARGVVEVRGDRQLEDALLVGRRDPARAARSRGVPAAPPGTRDRGSAGRTAPRTAPAPRARPARARPAPAAPPAPGGPARRAARAARPRSIRRASAARAPTPRAGPRGRPRARSSRPARRAAPASGRRRAGRSRSARARRRARRSRGGDSRDARRVRRAAPRPAGRRRSGARRAPRPGHGQPSR